MVVEAASNGHSDNLMRDDDWEDFWHERPMETDMPTLLLGITVAIAALGIVTVIVGTWFILGG